MIISLFRQRKKKGPVLYIFFNELPADSKAESDESARSGAKEKRRGKLLN